MNSIGDIQHEVLGGGAVSFNDLTDVGGISDGRQDADHGNGHNAFYQRKRRYLPIHGSHSRGYNR